MRHETRIADEFHVWRRRAAIGFALFGSCFALFGGRVVAEAPVARPSDAASDDTPDSLPDNVRTKLAGRLKQRAANTRIAALREIGEYRSVDAVDLILLYGLRDRTPAVHEAAARALLRHKTDARIGQHLVSQWEREATSKKRPNQDYTQRLLEIACDFHVPVVYRELLQLADQGEAALAAVVVEAIMTSVDKAAVEQDAALLPILEPLAASETFQRSFGFRRCVIDGAARVRHVDAVSFLVCQLRDQDGELRHVALQYLRRVTRQSLPSDTEAWEKWWQAERAKFTFAAESSLAVRLQEAEQGTPLYYDIPIHAKRLVFVLDTSRSMSAVTTVSRLDAAKRELISAIEQLPDGTLFNVIVFNSSVGRWSDKLAPATPNLKSKAIHFVRSQQPTGRTATYDALRAAFRADPQLEAIYFLSDGKPSAGAVIQPQMLLDAIHKENHARRLTINSIAVIGNDPDAVGLEEFMRRLATQNFGEFRRAE